MAFVRHDAAPVQRRFLDESRRRVEQKLGVGNGVAAVDAREVCPVVAPLVAHAPNGKYELEDWVIECELDAAYLLRLVLDVLLRLHDQLLEVCILELVLLVLVEINVGHFHVGTKVVRSEAEAGACVAHVDVATRDDDQLLELLEFDVQLDAVELERCDGERRAGLECEVEGEWNEQLTLLARVAH